jgi:hypothetical protein
MNEVRSRYDWDVLKGKTLVDVSFPDDGEVLFTFTDGEIYLAKEDYGYDCRYICVYGKDNHTLIDKHTVSNKDKLRYGWITKEELETLTREEEENRLKGEMNYLTHMVKRVGIKTIENKLNEIKQQNIKCLTKLKSK